MEGFDAMMRRSFKEEARRQLSVQPFTTPTRISKEYRNGYDEISWSVKK